jgi:hypothetical protein
VSGAVNLLRYFYNKFYLIYYSLIVALLCHYLSYPYLILPCLIDLYPVFIFLVLLSLSLPPPPPPPLRN